MSRGRISIETLGFLLGIAFGLVVGFIVGLVMR